MEPIVFSVLSAFAVLILLAAVADEMVDVIQGQMIFGRVLAATMFVLLSVLLLTTNLRMWGEIFKG